METIEYVDIETERENNVRDFLKRWMIGAEKEEKQTDRFDKMNEEKNIEVI
jgi:hypothetical protein